jgi:hypothetical protein
MATIKQIAANRLNALRSSGPRSVAGKAVSSMNALQSGIDAKSNLIRGEDSAALETLTREYRERFLPATPEERLLVDTLIHDEWLLRRFRRIDAEILECEMQDAWTPKDDCAAGQAFSRGQTAFSRLQRRIDSTERSYHRTLLALQKIASDAPPPDPSSDPEPLSDQPPAPAIGFVPSPPPEPAPEPAPDPGPCLPTPGPASEASLP